MKTQFRIMSLLAVFSILVLLSWPGELFGQNACVDEGGSFIPPKCDGDQDGYLKGTKKCLNDYGAEPDYCPVDCDDSNPELTNDCTEPSQDPVYYYRAYLIEGDPYYKVQHDDYDAFGDYVDGVDKVGIASTTNTSATGTFSFDTYAGIKLEPPGGKVAVRNVWMDLSMFVQDYETYFGEFIPSWAIPDEGQDYSGLISIDMDMGGLDLDALCVQGDPDCPDSECYMGRLGDCDSSESSPYGLVELQIRFPVDGGNPNDRARLVYCNPGPDMLQYEECLPEDNWTVVTRIGQYQWEIKGITATLGVLIPDLIGYPAPFVLTIERLH